MTVVHKHAYRLPIVVAMAMVILLLGCSRCVKRDGLQAEKEGFTVTMQADLSKLAVVAAGSQYLVGIDTTTFRMKAHIRWHGVQFDKLARLPDGGVLVVNERMGQSGWLYRLNPDCTLRDSVRLPNKACTPFVHGNLVIMGSWDFGPEGVSVMIYQLDSLMHRKTIDVMGKTIRQEDISAQGDRIFLPYDKSAVSTEQCESFPVMLDVNTLDTVQLRIGEPMKGKGAGAFVSAVCGDTLVVLPIGRCRPLLYDIASRRTLGYRDLEGELQAKLGGGIHGISSQPVIRDGMLHTLYADDSPGYRVICWVKIRLSDLSIVEAKRVLQDRGAWFAGDDFHTFGRFYVIEANIPQSSHFTATFIDWRTGEVAGQCTVDMPFGYMK